MVAAAKGGKGDAGLAKRRSWSNMELICGWGKFFRLFLRRTGRQTLHPTRVERGLSRGVVQDVVYVYTGAITLVAKMTSGLEQADARPPVVFSRLGVDDNLIRKGVGVGGGDGRNVVLVSVDNGDDLVRRFFEGFGHGAADFEHVYRWG